MMNLKLLQTSLLPFVLFVACTLSAQNVEKDWTAFSQRIDIGTSKKINFKLTASVKVDVLNTTGSAGLWARVDNKNDKTGFFDNMMDRPITSNSWNTNTIEGTLNRKSKQLYVGGLVMGNGKFEYDNFELYIENPITKVFDKVELTNASFEKEPKDGKIAGWNMGIVDTQDEKVEGYRNSLIDSGTHLTKSLLIVGEGVKKSMQNYIGPLEDYSPQIGTLVTMLNNLKNRVEFAVGSLSQAELDYLFDEEANSIGALLAHLTATEKLYQIITFEGREPTEEEMKGLSDAMELGELGRAHIKGKDAAYYLDAYTEARKETLRLFKEKDDTWLASDPDGSGTSNHFSWFHVMEHQSSHLGQVLLLKKRIPENLDLQLENPKKID